MPLKLFISNYTYRTLGRQLDVLRDEPQLQEAPVYTEDDIQNMFRPSQRVVRDTYYAASVACFAPTEEMFKEFIGQCRVKKVCLASIEEQFSWTPQQSTGGAVKAWKAGRRNGAAKAGGDAKAELSEADFWRSWEILEPRWHLPSKKENANKPLLKEADISRNTVKSYLGCTRVDWQGYSEARRRRTIKQKKADYARRTN